MMRRNLHLIVVLLLTVSFLGTFSGCKDDDNKKHLPVLEGNWSIAAFYTDNDNLNEILKTQLLPSLGVNPLAFKVSFTRDQMIVRFMPAESGFPADLPELVAAAYAYDEKQLALRFDVLPIPFNAFDIDKLTNEELALSNTLTNEMLKLAIELVSADNEELKQKLITILGASLKDGLKISVLLKRTV